MKEAERRKQSVNFREAEGKQESSREREKKQTNQTTQTGSSERVKRGGEQVTWLEMQRDAVQLLDGETLPWTAF